MIAEAVAQAKSRGFEGLLSYADLRHGTGNVYRACGFEFVQENAKNYWYTDGKQRFDRFKFRAQAGKSEKEVVEEAGVRPCFGCGNNVFLMKW